MGLQLVIDNQARGYEEAGTGNMVQDQQNASWH